jgi:hypothetical protein
MTSNQSTLEVAPSWSAYFRSAGKRDAVFVPLLVVIWFLARKPESSLAERLMPLVVGLVCGIVLMTLMVLVPRLRVSADALRYRTMVGQVRSLSRSEVHAAVLATEYRPVGTQAASPLLILADTQGRRFVQLNGYFWSRQSMDAVVAALSPPLIRVADEPLTARTFEKRYPGLLPYFHRHPYGILFIVTGFLAVVLIVALAR